MRKYECSTKTLLQFLSSLFYILSKFLSLSWRQPGSYYWIKVGTPTCHLAVWELTSLPPCSHSTRSPTVISIFLFTTAKHVLLHSEEKQLFLYSVAKQSKETNKKTWPSAKLSGTRTLSWLITIFPLTNQNKMTAYRLLRGHTSLKDAMIQMFFFIFLCQNITELMKVNQIFFSFFVLKVYWEWCMGWQHKALFMGASFYQWKQLPSTNKS